MGDCPPYFYLKKLNPIGSSLAARMTSSDATRLSGKKIREPREAVNNVSRNRFRRRLQLGGHFWRTKDSLPYIVKRKSLPTAIPPSAMGETALLAASLQLKSFVIFTRVVRIRMLQFLTLIDDHSLRAYRSCEGPTHSHRLISWEEESPQGLPRQDL
jgi:hypothetical protein